LLELKVPQSLPRFIETQELEFGKFISLENVIIANLEHLFPGMEIEDYYAFRLTRNADLEIEEDESENLLRINGARVVKAQVWSASSDLEVDIDIKSDLVKKLKEELSIKDEDISRYPEPFRLNWLKSNRRS
jgi:polyphosphate kinase